MIRTVAVNTDACISAGATSQKVGIDLVTSEVRACGRSGMGRGSLGLAQQEWRQVCGEGRWVSAAVAGA